MDTRPILGITMGDPAGIGAEIAAKVWAEVAMRRRARLLVIGDAAWMTEAMRYSGVNGRVRAVSEVGQAAYDDKALDVLDLGNVDAAQIKLGQLSPAAGSAAYDYVAKAATLALAGEIAAIVTPPLNKEALNAAGYHYDGHTGLLKTLTNAPRVTMMLVAGGFRVTHVSTHCSLSEAIARVRKDRILEVVRLTYATLCQMGFARPHLAVAGLNPHSGEGGLFGSEEIQEIQPAIDAAIAEGMNLYPVPAPPDTVFYRMAQRHEFDAVVAMYHDQGHIPAKLIGFADGVNVTLGLPIIRTSVDHGTAFDISGKGVADPSSLRQACDVALMLASGKSA